MEQAKKTFEMLMKPRNKDLRWDRLNMRYKNVNIQTKWRYFYLGWMQRGFKNGS